MSKHQLDVEAAVDGNAVEIRKGLESILGGGPHEFSMRLPLRDFGVPADLSLETDIVLTASIERDRMNLNDDLYVTFWAATTPDAFPIFSGVLDVFPDDTGSILELKGSYETPFGKTGDFFDSAIGHLIAQRCAKALLEHLGEQVQLLGVHVR